MDNTFGTWLLAELEKRDMSQSDLARLSGLHRQIINKTENGVSMPAVETYIALANAFGISPIFLFRKAGLLPPGPENKVKIDDWEFMLEKMPEDEQEELYEIGQRKVERRKQAEEQARAANRKLRPAER
jgi:transcriptional regulator with XRE-family HTH domain